MAWFKYLIAVGLFVFQIQSMAGDTLAGKAAPPVKPPHVESELRASLPAASTSKVRDVKVVRKDWTFNNCQFWNHDKNKAESSSFEIDLNEKPETWASFARVEGTIRRNSEPDLTFDMALGSEHTFLKETSSDFEGWVGSTDGYLGKEWHSVESTWRKSKKTNEKVFSVMTSKPFRQGRPNLTRFTILHASSTGEMAEIMLTFSGNSLINYRLIRSCGTGFGMPLTGNGISAEEGLRELPKSLGEFPESLPGKLALKRRAEAKQMMVADLLAHRIFRSEADKSPASRPGYRPIVDTQIARDQ